MLQLLNNLKFIQNSCRENLFEQCIILIYTVYNKIMTYNLLMFVMPCKDENFEPSPNKSLTRLNRVASSITVRLFKYKYYIFKIT